MTSKNTRPRKTKAAPKPKGKPGRKPTYDKDEMKPQIIKLLKRGLMLNEIAELPGFPSEDTVYDWMEEDEEFARLYAHTRAHSGPALMERGLKQLTQSTPDWVSVDREIANHLRFMAVKMDNRLKDNHSVELSGIDGKPIETTLSVNEAHIGAILGQIKRINAEIEEEDGGEV